MKTKYFLFAAVMPLALASCSDEQYLDQANAVGRDDLGELIEAPLLGGGIGGEAQTRVFEGGIWSWKPEMDGKTVSRVDAIGLCWTGVVNGEEYQGPQATTGDMVYTNNKFEHAGWLFKGETAPKFHCGKLNNGAFHSYFPPLTPDAEYNEDNKTWTANNGELDFERGIFKSASATIYSGEYIVYSPYNPAFWNAPVTATQEREMTLTVTEKEGTQVIVPDELMTKYAFTVGYVPTIKGGDATSEFNTKMLSSGLHFNLISNSGLKIIKEIVLWTKGEKGIILKQPLSAQKIKEAMQSGQLTTGVYMEREEGDAVSSMVVKLGKNGLKVSSTETKFYVPVLPYEKAIENLNILLVDDQGKTAIIKRTDYTFGAGNPSLMTLIIDGDDVYQGSKDNPKAQGKFSDVNYAYDDDSFWRAYGQAFNAGSNATEDARTVRLLDDVRLTTSTKVTKGEDGKEKYEDYYNVDPTHDGVIIDVAEGETAKLILGNENAIPISSDDRGVVSAYKYYFNKTTFGVDVVAEAWGCCGAGKVNLSLTNCNTKEGTQLTMYGGTLYLGKEINLYGNVASKFEGTDEEGVNHVGEWNRIPGVYLTQKAVVNVYAEFRNEGTMKIQSQNNELGEDIKGNSKFNLRGGQFVNASTEKGDGTLYKASVIVEGNGKTGEDGIFNIRNSSTATATVDNYGDIYNHGNIDNDRGTFTNRANASFTDYVGSSLSGSRLVNEDETAEFICEVNSEVRYNAAIAFNGIRPTTTVRFVYGEKANIAATGATFTTTYTLKPNTNKGNGIYVPGASGEQLVKFESAIDNTTSSTINELILKHTTVTVGEEKQPVPTNIGSVTVKSGRISIMHEALTINGDYTANGALNSYFPVGIQKITGDMNLTTVKDDKIGATGNVTLLSGKELNIDGNLNAIDVKGSLTFNAKSKVNVGGDIVITKAKNTTFGLGTSVKAKNMDVQEGSGTVTFDKNNVTYLGEKDVDGVLTNNGIINIVNAVSGSDAAAVVWCNSREGDGIYQNNSWPQYYK